MTTDPSIENLDPGKSVDGIPANRRANPVRILVAFFAATLAAVLAFPALECGAALLAIGDRRCGDNVIDILLLGFFLAIPAVIFVGLPLFLMLRHFRWVAWWQIVLAASFSSIVAFVTVVPALVSWDMRAIAGSLVALPLVLVLKRFGSPVWWRIAIGIVLAGLFVLLVFVVPPTSEREIRTLGLLAYAGACAGIVFWFVGVRGNEP